MAVFKHSFVHSYYVLPVLIWAFFTLDDNDFRLLCAVYLAAYTAINMDHGQRMGYEVAMMQTGRTSDDLEFIMCRPLSWDYIIELGKCWDCNARVWCVNLGDICRGESSCNEGLRQYCFLMLHTVFSGSEGFVLTQITVSYLGQNHRPSVCLFQESSASCFGGCTCVVLCVMRHQITQKRASSDVPWWLKSLYQERYTWPGLFPKNSTRNEKLTNTKPNKNCIKVRPWRPKKR